MKAFIACLIAAAILVVAGAPTLEAGEVDAPNGIYVKGCPDYTLVEGRVQQLCAIDSIPPHDFLSVTEFLRAFRGSGGRSDGGSDGAPSTSD